MESTVTLPLLGEGIQSGTVVKVLVGPGKTVAAGDPLIEIESGKAIVPVPSPYAGTVERVVVREGQEIPVGQQIVTMAVEEKEEQPASPVEKKIEALPPLEKRVEGKEDASPPMSEPESESDYDTHAGPAARKLARELGVELAHVRGTAPGGRVTPDDVKAYVRSFTHYIKNGTDRAASSAVPAIADDADVEARPMSGLRKAVAQAMETSRQIPHVFHFHDLDVTEIMQALKALKQKKVSITIAAVLIKAVAEVLKEMPAFNASVDMAAHQMRFNKSIHIGIAIDTKAGLIVAVMREVDTKEVLAIGDEIRILAQKANDRTLEQGELYGAGFNISNLGALDASYFTPLIVPPQVATLGVGRARPMPVYTDGIWLPRDMLPLSLSYDHRAIDGADAARFMQKLTEVWNKIVLVPELP